MLRLFFILVVLVVAACNLENNLNATADAPPTLATAASSICVIRQDWPIYEVQPGDVLTNIAILTESTIEELAQANCLTNPNDLNQGQELRVPRLPESP